MLFSTAVTAFANETALFNDLYYQHSASVLGYANVEQLGENIFQCEIDCNSVITFDAILDELYVSEDIKGGDSFYSFYYGEEKTNGTCTVNYETATREDTKDFYSDDSAEDIITYMLPGASVRFNTPGTYMITACLGAKDAVERWSLLSYIEEGKGDFRTLDIIVNVLGETSSVNPTQRAEYDTELVSVSGITNYDFSREVMYNDRVALCTAPVIIEAQTDLVNFIVNPLEMVNGEWNFGWEMLEFDGLTMNEQGFVPAKKGDKMVITKPGMYELWAEKNNERFTGLAFEIVDSTAIYTSSKVLVDGKEVKFEAYNINGNNYFKLRDIACAFQNSSREFEIQWDGERNKVTMISNRKYTPVGGELVVGDGTNKTYQRSENALVKDGSDVSLTAFLINGNNYFKLRDLGRLFDFNVSWDGANNCVMIDTTCSYMEE